MIIGKRKATWMILQMRYCKWHNRRFTDAIRPYLLLSLVRYNVKLDILGRRQNGRHNVMDLLHMTDHCPPAGTISYRCTSIATMETLWQWTPDGSIGVDDVAGHVDYDVVVVPCSMVSELRY